MNETNDNTDQEEGLSLLDLWDIIVKHWIAIVVFVLIFTIGGFAVSKIQGKISPKYTASASMLISGENESLNTTQTYQYSNYISKTFADFIKTDPVIDETAKEFGKTYSEIKSGVSTSITTNSLFITVHYTCSSKEDSVKILNALLDNAESVSNTLDTNGKPRYELLYNNIKTFSLADIDKVNKTSNTKKYTLIAFAAGVVVAACYVFISEITDKKFKSIKDIEKVCEIPVISTIPEYDFNSEKEGK